MNQAMATVYEGQLRRCKLLQENVHSVDSHFNFFGRNHYEGILKESLANNNDFLNLF